MEGIGFPYQWSEPRTVFIDGLAKVFNSFIDRTRYALRWRLDHWHCSHRAGR